MVDEHRCTVVVIGAGYSGLASAHLLTRSGVDVLVCEARSRVGGRAATQVVDGVALDLGGEFVGPGQRRILALAAEFGVSLSPVWRKGEDIVWRDGKRWSEHRGVPDAESAMVELDRLASSVPLEAPWLTPDAEELDGQTMRTWLASNVASDDGRWLLRTVLEATFAASVKELSLLHVLFGIRAAAGTTSMFGGAGCAQDSSIVGGAMGIAERLLWGLGESVLLGHRVNRVVWGDAHVAVEGPGFRIAADRAIFALPPHLAGRLCYDPSLPARRDSLTQSLPMGAVVKVHCLYDRPFWRDRTLSGGSMSDDDWLSVTTHDGSPQLDGPGLLTCLVPARAAQRWVGARPDEVRVRLLRRLAELFGPEAARPAHVVAKTWPDDPLAGGGYDAHFPPGLWTALGDALRAPIGPLHWAGSETATEWCGYLDGALTSGERAAMEVLNAVGSPGAGSARPGTICS